jgi:threonine synthase
MKNRFIGYRCSICQTEYSPVEVTYTCPKDGGNLDVVLDYATLKRKFSPLDLVNQGEASMWHFSPLLPIEKPENAGTPLGTVGGTPVYNIGRLARKLGLANLWIKDESRNPTASFKDRASAVVLCRAKEIKADVVVTASTGNAGAALAGIAAAVGQKAVIFAPKTAPPAKVAQLLAFGAKVLLVDGTYDDAFDLSVLAAQEFGWYCRNTGYNPFTLEGKKTAAFEIWSWWHRASELAKIFENLSIFVSVGDGNIISGLHKGFRDLHALGWLEKSPRIFGVQAEGSAAIANAFFQGAEKIVPVRAETLADSISVDLPRDGVRAVRAAVQTSGQYVVVSDQEILAAISELGATGVFAEPAGAASYAGLVKAVQLGLIGEADPVLVINTGSGLKDTKSALLAVGEAPVIQPDLESVKNILAG